MGFIVSLLALLLSVSVFAAPKEADYVDKFCQGDIEVTVISKFRIDCVEDLDAIEYDWASKWAECLGQSMKYAQVLGKTASCILIVKTDSDEEKALSTHTLIEHFRLPVKLYTVRWGDSKPTLFEF